jgi:drug/metabolite transporter (DMT)-like permease
MRPTGSSAHPMSLLVFFSVLGAALMHAGWSALIKHQDEPRAISLAVAMGGGVIAAVLLIFLPPPAPASWPFLLGTTIIHVIYFQTTIAAYRHGDLTLTYPIARGMAPALASVLALFFLAESPSVIGWAGIGAIVLGAMMVASEGFAMDKRGRMAVLFALAAAAATACYTLADGQGARLSEHALSFTSWLMVLMAGTNMIAMRFMFGGDVIVRAVKRLPLGLVGGAASFGSYAVALWAMTQAPIALVAALRETSIAFAVLLGLVFLKEQPRLWRIFGSLTILAGAATLRLS